MHNAPWSWRLALAAVAFSALTWTCTAQGPGQITPEERDTKFVRTYARDRLPATGINFPDEYDLGWPSLATLGSRIEEARLSPDPVALAHNAGELAVAEKVSGQKAPLTSAALLRESVGLAALRRQPTELQALGELTRTVASDEQLSQELQQDLARAKREVAQLTPQIDPQPVFPQKTYPVLVENYTEEYISIYMNGHFALRVPPLRKRFLNIIHETDPTVLMGYSTIHSWGPRNIWGTLREYQWVLLPPKTASDDPCAD